MQFTIREMTGGWVRHALAALALGLFLTFLGPFRSGAVLSTGPRVLYWLTLVTTGYLLALAGFKLLGDKPKNPFVRALAVAALASIPQMFLVSWVLVQTRPGRIIGSADLPMLFLSVCAIEIVIVAVQLWVLSGWAQRQQSAVMVAGAPRGRIPTALRNDLIALEAEDHYVRIHHGAGSTLILHRFGDALSEVDPTLGLQVHRGWWVATAAVRGTFLRGEKRFVALANGLNVPVSRTHQRAVSERRWPKIVPPPVA